MTIFFRVLEDAVDDKAASLLRAIGATTLGRPNTKVFAAEPEQFREVPNSPFAYWISERLRAVFRSFSTFESAGRTVKQGLSTSDDFRFVRGWWEVGELCSELDGRRWFSFAKGGARSAHYAAIPAKVNWHANGREMKAWTEHSYGGHWSRNLRNTDRYLRSGLTWPLRGVVFSAQAVPAGCIFSVAGKMAFAEEPQLGALLALFNSVLFNYLIGVSAGKVGGVQYEVGLIQRMPVPMLAGAEESRLSNLARRAWFLKRWLDTTNETSHAFLLPPGPNEKVTALNPVAVERELSQIQSEINQRVFQLYDIGLEDRAIIEASSKRVGMGDDPPDESEGEYDDASDAETPVGTPADTLISWLVGVSFGRFDPRLAIGERFQSAEPEPFDPLPSRSPGMFLERDEAADRSDILVDEGGHPRDLAARVRRWAEHLAVDVPSDLRQWLAREFFPLHIKMYSKSRRKAPIYWQLATPSASYSVWLYIHAFSKDTLFRVQNDYVAPKLSHEERRLEGMTSEAREKGTAAQRKELSAQEDFVGELRAFLDELKRVTPLWNPNLDDGVIINFAPLWRLAPQHKPWQKELKSTWDALCEGKYDWAHLAMHLWPERVVPKCATDRSLAIAHGLEDVFWVEENHGKWTARKKPTQSVEDLVSERTSPAVKAALKSLLDAPQPAGSGRKSKKG